MNRFLFNHRTDFRVAAGTSCRPRVRFVIGSLAIIVAMVGAIGFARAADELPSQDQALAQALENHPDIVAAKAKVALAEAELYGKRMEVSRQVLGLYGSVKTLDAEASEAKAALAQSRIELEQMKKPATGEQANQSTREKVAVQTAERKLVVATGQREQAERELRLLIGTPAGTKEAKSKSAATAPARQAPQGLIVDNWKGAAEASIKLSVTEMPLADLMDFLSDKTGIKFSLQRPALEVAGEPTDTPITLSTNDVSLRAALQGFEDAYPTLQFVLRDYGVLLTTKESVREHGYTPALEIGNEGTGVKSR